MKSDGIFDMAGNRLAWLAVRRAAVAANIANASTPGYRSREVAPFAAHVAASARRDALATTSPRHLAASASDGASGEVEVGTTGGSAVHSGNSINLDLELLKAGEVARAHLLATGVVRAFHRLSIAATKS